MDVGPCLPVELHSSAVLVTIDDLEEFKVGHYTDNLEKFVIQEMSHLRQYMSIVSTPEYVSQCLELNRFVRRSIEDIGFWSEEVEQYKYDMRHYAKLVDWLETEFEEIMWSGRRCWFLQLFKRWRPQETKRDEEQRKRECRFQQHLMTTKNLQRKIYSFHCRFWSSFDKFHKILNDLQVTDWEFLPQLVGHFRAGLIIKNIGPGMLKLHPKITQTFKKEMKIPDMKLEELEERWVKRDQLELHAAFKRRLLVFTLLQFGPNRIPDGMLWFIIKQFPLWFLLRAKIQLDDPDDIYLKMFRWFLKSEDGNAVNIILLHDCLEDFFEEQC